MKEDIKWTSDPRGLPKEVKTETGRVLTDHGIILPADDVRVSNTLRYVSSGAIHVGTERDFRTVPVYRQKTGLSLLGARIMKFMGDESSGNMMNLVNAISARFKRGS